MAQALVLLAPVAAVVEGAVDSISVGGHIFGHLWGQRPATTQFRHHQALRLGVGRPALPAIAWWWRKLVVGVVVVMGQRRQRREVEVALQR